MAKTIIIGAGLTGISTAYHLEKHNYFDYKIFEKESSLGGLCGSIEQDGFTFDYTGHLLHASDDYFYSLIEKIVGLQHLNVINRRSFIYSQNTYTHYPYQINLRGLPTQTIAECIEGFVTRSQSQKAPLMFRDWVLQNFGHGFGKHFFFPYQEKIFAHDLNNITASWTGRFVPSTSLTQIIDGALGNTKRPVGYNARFLYPKKGGILFWVRQLAKQLHNAMQMQYTVQKIDVKNKMVHFANGHTETYETLITTMPLDRLLGCLDKSAFALKKAQHKLLCNSVINFNLGINRAHLSDKHWIYFPETKYPFYRMGFWHNFSEHMAPKGCSSLYGEFAHIGKSAEWIQRKTDACINQTKKLFAISDDEIITQKIIPISHAYVIYDQWRDDNLDTIHKRLREYNIHSIGRYGQWKYASMQEAVLDGKKTAEEIILNNVSNNVATHFIPSTKQKEIQHG